METVSIREIRPPLVIEQIETAILERLKAELSGQVRVDAFPNDPAKYDFANLPAAALVHYVGSKYAPREGPVRTDQRRKQQFAIVLLARSLRGQGGAYMHLEDIRLALQGSSFAGAGPAEIVRDELQSEQDGVWRWWVEIAIPVPAVARQRQPQAPLMRPIVHSGEK